MGWSYIVVGYDILLFVVDDDDDDCCWWWLCNNENDNAFWCIYHDLVCVANDIATPNINDDIWYCCGCMTAVLVLLVLFCCCCEFR